MHNVAFATCISTRYIAFRDQEFPPADAIRVDYRISDFWRWTMTRMHNPPHPGVVLADTVLRVDGGMTVTEFAERLGVSRVALSRVVNGRAAVSAELAIRLGQALGTSAEVWMGMQIARELWEASKKRRPKIKRIAHRPLGHAEAAEHA